MLSWLQILERLDFLEQIRRLFREIEDLDMLETLANTTSSLDGENYDLNEIWDSVIASEKSYEWNFNHVRGFSSREPIGNAYSSASLDDSFSFITAEEGVTLLNGDSYCLSDQLTNFI